jgi:hypothetical protein
MVFVPIRTFLPTARSRSDMCLRASNRCCHSPVASGAERISPITVDMEGSIYDNATLLTHQRREWLSQQYHSAHHAKYGWKKLHDYHQSRHPLWDMLTVNTISEMNVWGTMLSRPEASQSFYASTRTRQSIYTFFFSVEGKDRAKCHNTADQPLVLVSLTYIWLVSVSSIGTLVLLCSASWNDNVSISCFDELGLLISISLRFISDCWHPIVPLQAIVPL